MQCCACTWWTGDAAECMVYIKTSMLNDASEAMCEQKGRAGAEKWANLVSPRCVMADLPGKHVERLATVSHARMRRLLHPRRRLQAPTDPRSTMKALACSRPGARRKVRCASHLRVESSPRHTKRVSANPAIRTVAISIVHQRSSPEHRKTGRMIAPARKWCMDEWRLASAHASRSAVGLRSRREGASKCSEILVHLVSVFWFVMPPHS